MDVKEIKSEKKICICCMEEHNVKTVRMMNKSIFKNVQVEYEVTSFYCDLSDEYYFDEQQVRDNDLKLKNAYRKKWVC